MPAPRPRIKPSKRIPIAAAKRVAQEYGMDQVILLAWSKEAARTHFVSYGKDRENCRQAAEGIKNIRRFLGFEGSETDAAPEPPRHVCGLQGFGALDDKCPACNANYEQRIAKDEDK